MNNRIWKIGCLVAVLLVVVSGFVGVVCAETVFKPPFSFADDSIKLVEGSHSVSFCDVDKNSGKMGIGTGASVPLIGEEWASAVGLIGEKVYIPSDGTYKITINATLKGKIVAWHIQALPTSASGSEIILGCRVFGNNEEKDIVFIDRKIATIDLFSDAFQAIIDGLAKELAGISVTPIVGVNYKGINFDGTHEHSEEVYLERGHYSIYPYFETISVAVAFIAGEQSYADFIAGSIYEAGDPDPTAIEYVRINEFKIEELGGENAPPVAKFSPTSKEVYVGQRVTFDASESKDYDGEITEYYWEFTNGNPPASTSKTPTVTWYKQGIYTVKLKVKDNDGAWSSFTGGTVTVENRDATGSISIDPENPVKMQSITFKANVNDPDGIASYVWDFGDGESITTTIETVTHSYDKAGDYEVKLTVIDKFDGATRFTKIVTVKEWSSSSNIRIDKVWVDGEVKLKGGHYPRIDDLRVYYKGYADKVSGVEDYDIRVIDESSGIVIGTDDGNGKDLDEYLWCEMDRTIFRETGKHSLKVIAHHTNGGTAEALLTLDVGVDNYRNNDFNIFPSHPYAYETITLDASHLTRDTGGNPVKYYSWVVWKRGDPYDTRVYKTPDGESEKKATVKLQESGKYTIYVVNSKTGSGTVIDDANIWVRDEGYYEPHLTLTEFTVPNKVIKEKGCPVRLKIKNTGHEYGHYVIRYKVDGKIVEVDTGYVSEADGSTPEIDEESEILDLPTGTHTVSIDFINAHNKLITRSATVNVVENKAPTAKIESIKPDEIFVGDEVTFIASAKDDDGEVKEITWNFGDGETGKGKTVKHIYAEHGLYVVRLTVTDDCGASSSYTKEITVNKVNTPPYKPSNPSPENGATNVDINEDLSWSCSDPDGDSLKYDVYFGTSPNPAKVKSNYTSTTFDPETMNKGTKYYWKIVAKDGKTSTSGDVWHFTTAPLPKPPTITSVSPTSEATNVPVTTKISATFSEAMNTASVEAAFSITPSVAGTFSWVENTMTFTPIANLAHSTTYTVTISATATDMAGNGLDGNENGIAEGSPTDDYTWSFTTEEMRKYGVDLSCANPEKSIPSGGYATYNITVKNTGNVEDTIKVTTSLPPLPLTRSPWTYSLDKYSVELSPGESTEVVLTVSDISDKGLPAGSSCEVEVIGISQGDPTKSDSVLTKTTIGDWNPWNDPDSEGGESVTTAELQEAIHCWLNDELAPKTGAEITTASLQEVIHQWLVG